MVSENNTKYLGKKRDEVLASLFRATTRLLFPVISLWDAVDGRRKYTRMIQDIECEMPWTITHLHPQIIVPAHRKLAMSRYATVTLRCPSYFIWITREFYGAEYDFWADVGSLANPDSRIRIDTFDEQMSRSVDGVRLKPSRKIPTTLSDLDSLISTIAPELEAFFCAN